MDARVKRGHDVGIVRVVDQHAIRIRAVSFPFDPTGNMHCYHGGYIPCRELESSHVPRCRRLLNAHQARSHLATGAKSRTRPRSQTSIGVDFVRLRLVLFRAEHRSKHDDG